MKVLILDTGRGIAAEKVQTWRTQLGLDDGDQLSLVGWFPTKVPLPVTRHLVCGPELRLGHEPTDAPVQPPGQRPPSAQPAGSTTNDGPAPSEADAAVTAEGGGLTTSDLEEQLTEQEAHPDLATAADQERSAPRDTSVPGEPEGEGPSTTSTTSPTNLSHLAVYDPRRVRQAVRWRRKWAQRKASRFVSRQARRARAVTKDVPHLPSAVVRSSLARRKDAIAWEFALATTRSRAVNDVFRTADVVVPVDARSQKAAWLLARRHAGPDVLVTLPGAARALAARRTRR